MPLNKYRVFAKIAETGNMRRAAKEMMYTQQAVSRIVKCMEEEYQFPLFIRERDGVRLTPEAERMLPAVNALLVEEDKLISIINDIQTEAGLIKQIHVGACGSIVVSAVQDTLTMLADNNPEIKVGVHYNADYSTINKNLKAGDLDCVVTVEGNEGDMDFEAIFKEKFFAVMPSDHPLADEDVVSLSNLLKYPNVITSDNPNYDEIMSNTEHHTVVVDEEILMMPIIAKNRAVGITSGISQFENSFGVKIVPLEEEMYRVLGIATRPNEEPSELTKLFIDTFKEATKDYI